MHRLWATRKATDKAPRCRGGLAGENRPWSVATLHQPRSGVGHSYRRQSDKRAQPVWRFVRRLDFWTFRPSGRAGGAPLFFLTVKCDSGGKKITGKTIFAVTWGFHNLFFDRLERLWGIPIALSDRCLRSSRNFGNDQDAFARDVRRSNDAPGGCGDLLSPTNVSYCCVRHCATPSTNVEPDPAVAARVSRSGKLIAP